MKHIAIIALALSTLPARAFAQPPVVPLTVDDAVARALEVSHRLGELRAREQGAQAAAQIRRAADRPTLAVNGGYTRTNHVEEFGVPLAGGGLRVIYPDVPDNYFTRLSFQWPIYTGGRADALERAAEAEARAIGAELQVSRADLRLEVIRAYWAVVTATEAVQTLEKGVASADLHVRDVRSRYDAGVIPPNEVSTAEAQRSRRQMQLIEARNLRASVVEDLKRLTGLAADADIAITDRLLPPAGTEVASWDGGRQEGRRSLAGTEVAGRVQGALPQRAERQALVERLAAAEDRQRAAASGSRPSVALTGSLDYANPNPRIFPRKDEWRESWDVSVNVSWPLWDAGRTRAEIAEAAAAATAVRERLADLEGIIATEVRQRRLDIDSARAGVAAAADGVRAAEETQRVVSERYAVGVATSGDVIDAQGLLLDAELDRTRVLATLRLAEARLDRALGR